jgi:transcriptional regulator with XRE-family HTH domain
MIIGKKLKTLRISKGYEPIEIAERLGISKTTYGRYERNETVPDMNMLEKIAIEYDISITDLLSDDKVILSNDQKGGTSNNALVINQLSEKLIEQYELRLKKKNEIIEQQKETINQLMVMLDKKL